MWGLKRLRVGSTSRFQAVKMKLSHRTLKQRHELGSNRVLYTYRHNFLVRCATEGYIHRVSHNWKRNFESQKSWVSLLSPFLSFYGLSERFHLCKHRLFSIFLYNFAREIGAWPAKIDPVAHARCLTVVLSYCQGSGPWIHLLLVPIKYVQPNWKTLSDWYKWK